MLNKVLRPNLKKFNLLVKIIKIKNNIINRKII